MHTTKSKYLLPEQSRLLRIIFGSKRDEVIRGSRKLHTEEIHGLMHNASDSARIIKSRRMRWTGQKERMGEMRNEYSILIGNPEESRPTVLNVWSADPWGSATPSQGVRDYLGN
jgi:hypothetical protein